MRQLKLAFIAVTTILLFTSASIAQDCEDVIANPFTNCGFETGNFTGWVTQDLTIPFFNLQVGVAGMDPGFGLFVSDPPQGVFAALTGFDGNGPGVIRVAQDVSLLPGPSELVFEYQCGWDITFASPTLPRRFEVNIEESGGGALLLSELIVEALPNTTELPSDGPNRTVVVDVTAVAGQDVRVNFDWIVPENLTGPAFCQLDNVSIAVANIVRPIPTLSEWGLIAMAGVLGIVGLLAIRRRKAAA